MAKNYNPKKVIGIVNGIVIVGYAPDTFINCSNTEDLNTLTVGNDGKGTFNENPNESGSITFTLQHNSDSIKELMALSVPGVPPFPIAVNDSNMLLSGKSAGINCKLRKRPDLERAKEVGTVEFEFLCERLIIMS